MDKEQIWLDLAIKAITLKPELLTDIKSIDELRDSITRFAAALAKHYKKDYSEFYKM
jgi:hypothetical protein